MFPKNILIFIKSICLVINDLIKNKESITKIQTNGNNLLDIDAKVINLLKNNINTWVIKDNAIYFYSKSVMTEYNTLINSIS